MLEGHNLDTSNKTLFDRTVQKECSQNRKDNLHRTVLEGHNLNTWNKTLFDRTVQKECSQNRKDNLP